MHQYLKSYHAHKLAAHESYDVFVDLCGGHAPPRVPGMDTVIRLAWRIECGRTVAEAALREYLYRWSIAIRPGDQCINTNVRNSARSAFGTPHTIGM